MYLDDISLARLYSFESGVFVSNNEFARESIATIS